MRLIELFENDYDHREHLERTGFWGRRGAGCLFLAADTGRILFQHRSKHVEQPHTWGTWGGAIDSDETPEDAVRREAMEETSHDVQIMQMIPLFVFNKPGIFQYFNYLVVVPHEFEPGLDPNINWETQGYRWCTFGQWPSPLHFGAQLLTSDRASMVKIQQAIEKYKTVALKKKTA
jgi:8-oxo-dGTP pyrophosphatase MutT (NUDIX family)